MGGISDRKRCHVQFMVSPHEGITAQAPGVLEHMPCEKWFLVWCEVCRHGVPDREMTRDDVAETDHISACLSSGQAGPIIIHSKMEGANPRLRTNRARGHK